MNLKPLPPAATILWLSDLHLDQAEPQKVDILLDEIAGSEYSALVVSGDTTSSARSLSKHLRQLASASNRAIYLVLGNHEFHGGSIDSVEREVTDLCRRVKNLHHLEGNEVIPLSQNTALVGHRGWADARAGWGKRTIVPSRDHHSIEDFKMLSRQELFSKMESLGRESARSFRKTLPYALSVYQNLVILTHVPPFPETAYFRRRPCGPTHLPHFTNLSAGLTIRGIARKFPHRFISVLSGHTHGQFRTNILNNLEARVGQARRGNPVIQAILEYP